MSKRFHEGVHKSMYILSLNLVRRITSSALPMKAVKILGSVEHAADLNALKNCGWIIDEEKDCIKKKFQFKDFNQVCETFNSDYSLKAIVNF